MYWLRLCRTNFGATMLKMAVRVLVPTLAIALATTLPCSFPAAHADVNGLYDITGIVDDSAGNPIADVSVTATDPGGSSTDYGPVVTAADGSYDLQVAAGTYDIHFTPDASSGLSVIVQTNYVVSSDQTLDVQLDNGATTTSVSGVVTDADGNPDPGVQIEESQDGVIAATDSSGNYSADVQPGNEYYLQAEQNLGGGVAAISTVYNFIQPTAGSSTIQNFQLPDTSASLTITALDENGNPATSAWVDYSEYGPDCPDADGACTSIGPAGDGDGFFQITSTDGQITFPSIPGFTFKP